MVTCINLRKRFGSEFRIAHEESYRAERPEFRRQEEPWLQIIPCQHGHICPWGGDLLAACTNRSGIIPNRLRALPFANVVQDGDDGANITFPVEHFEAVAAIMHPKRRRHCALSVEQRQINAERMRRINQERKERRVHDAGGDLESTQTPQVDTLPV